MTRKLMAAKAMIPFAILGVLIVIAIYRATWSVPSPIFIGN